MRATEDNTIIASSRDDSGPVIKPIKKAKSEVKKGKGKVKFCGPVESSNNNTPPTDYNAKLFPTAGTTEGGDNYEDPGPSHKCKASALPVPCVPKKPILDPQVKKPLVHRKLSCSS